MASEATSLPIGAMVLVSDGADNSGGVDRETIAEVRRRRIPVHTVGIGREQFERDIEITDAVLPARTLADSRVSAQVTLRQRGFEERKVRLVISDGGKPLASQEVTLARQRRAADGDRFSSTRASPARRPWRSPSTRWTARRTRRTTP